MAVLNIKTNNYLLHSMIKIKDLIECAKEHNISALTITDNNMYGALEFYNECIKNNIKPIIGLEISMPEKIVLYAKNYDGYKNLMKLTTIKSEKQLEEKDLLKYSDNLICIIPYESRVHYSTLNKIYEDLFVSYKSDEEKSKINLKNKLYMKEILCIKKEDEKYLKYLEAIKEGKNYLEIEEFKDVSLLPIKEDNIIEKMCDIKIKMHMDLLPVYTDSSYEYLKKQCIIGMKRIFGTSAPKRYAVRLKQELEVIKNMGFCDYFLVVQDYVKYAKENGILVGPGRGSAAGSLVSYTLDITTIDPLKYDLLFERFLNQQRVTMPDIDIDFEDDRRIEVIDYCVKKYGEKKVALIITFGTLASKQAVRDVGRTLDIDLKKIDTLSKMLDPRKTLKQNLTDRVKNYITNNPELKKVYKIALKFEGLKRHTSIHAAGVVMSKKDLDESLPMDKIEGLYISEYDKDYLEDLGLLKMDFLGIKNLTMINNILKEIDDLSFDTIKEDDRKALDIFKNVNTKGIFQFESPGMINFLKKLRPDTFNDIIAALALFRPGPMKNIDSYIRRKRKIEKIDYFHDDLKDILKPTYGIIVYQEQIMQIASTLAGYTFQEADILRRAMSKKKQDILIKEEEKFIKGAQKKGYEKSLAKKVYDLIFKFAEYGFNKSHTVAYAMISYKMAYLKAHYPKIFMKHLLNNSINSVSKTKEYISECQKYGIKIKEPNINYSSKTYTIIDEKILYPLTNIKNVGINAVNIILEEREKGRFKDIFDFVRRCYKGSVTSKTIESLIYSGSLDNLGYNRKTLIDNLETIINYAEISSLDDEIFKPELEEQREYAKEEILKFELDYLGIYLKDHPVTTYKRNNSSVDLKDIKMYFDKVVNVIVYTEKIRIVDTKKGEKMMFISTSDELDKIDIVVFPKVFNNIKEIKEGDILKIKGRVQKRFNEYQIVAQSITVLNK